MNNSQDNIQKRRGEILDYINTYGQSTVSNIASALNLNSVTVRRDIDALASEHKVDRFFGGVRPVDAKAVLSGNMIPKADADTFAYRMLYQYPIDEKKLKYIRRIAKTAAYYVENGDVLLLNNSLTASYVIDYLEEKSVVIFTNCMFVLARKCPSNVKLCFLGGQLQVGRAGLSGGMTIAALSGISATKCIMGFDGIDILSGLTSKSLEESYVNQEILAHTTGKRIVVATGDKIATKSAFYSGDLRSVSLLITDETASQVELSHFKNIGVEYRVIHAPD